MYKIQWGAFAEPSAPISNSPASLEKNKSNFPIPARNPPLHTHTHAHTHPDSPANPTHYGCHSAPSIFPLIVMHWVFLWAGLHFVISSDQCFIQFAFNPEKMVEKNVGEMYWDKNRTRNKGESSNAVQQGDNAGSGRVRFTFMASSHCFNTHTMKI